MNGIKIVCKSVFVIPSKSFAQAPENRSIPIIANFEPLVGSMGMLKPQDQPKPIRGPWRN